MLVENGHDAVVASRWRVSRFADARSTGLEISTGFSVRGRALMRLRQIIDLKNGLASQRPIMVCTPLG